MEMNEEEGKGGLNRASGVFGVILPANTLLRRPVPVHRPNEKRGAKMALRILRASSSTLARQFQRPLFFSTSPQGTLFGDGDSDHTASASTDANANNDGGPPTSVIYPRANNPFFLPSNKNATTTAAAPISTNKTKKQQQR